MLCSRSRVIAFLTILALGSACPGPAQQTAGTAGPSGGDTTQPTTAPSLIHPGEVHLADVIQLTRDSGENAEAYWSFDNKQLIFQTTRPPYECDQIMTVPADGSAPPTLVSTGKGRTTCAYFLPGDQEIVYSSTHEVNATCPPKPDFSKGYIWALYDYDVYRANADGSNLRKLTNRAGYDAEATVCSKDGSIIFTSDRDGDLELYRMDADGSNVTRLTNTPGYDGGAFFSQDCSQIVWRASRHEGAELEEYQALLKQKLVRPSKLEIFIAKPDGSDVRQITYLDSAAFAPYFHPSGKRVLFSTSYGDRRGREFNIWAVDTDGTNMKQITFAPGFDGFPMFSHDGTKLAFASNRNQAKDRETDVFVARWVDNPPQASQASQAPSVTADAERFKAHVTWLADDAREGRGVGTAGLDQAADWLAERFKELGAAGAADAQGGYKQPLDMPVALVREPATSLTIGNKTIDAKAFTPVWFSARKRVSAPVVFANYGIVAKELGIDDYRRIKAKGKIVVVRRFTPSKKPFDNNDARRRYGDLEHKAFVARQRGAVGLIVVDLPGPGEPEAADAALPALQPEGQGDAGIPIMMISREQGAKLARGWHRVTMNVAMRTEKKPVYNVVAKIAAGAQNRLPGAVVIGAHYDHLGKVHPGSLEVAQDVIHNGADDNASGTAGLVAIAEALAKNPAALRRDVYFVAFTAEESGLIGSAHFVDHLPDALSAENIVAMLNMDMIGRLRDNKLAVLGAKSALEWNDIVVPACKTARVQCSLGGDGYGPSDQMAFYSKGIPVLHFFTGGHVDYHRGSDDSEYINFIGAVKVAEVVRMVAESIANRESRLTYQKAPTPPPRGDVRATGGSLGTIPAYGGDGETPGVLLGDVRPGGPAANAGVRGGDRIVRIGQADIRTIRDLLFVLRQATPGEKTKITVIRNGKRVTMEATYGTPRRRGPSSRR